jgi:hypothetical protein
MMSTIEQEEREDSLLKQQESNQQEAPILEDSSSVVVPQQSNPGFVVLADEKDIGPTLNGISLSEIKAISHSMRSYSKFRGPVFGDSK